MTKILWGTIGERIYEAGVDRGVLYAPGHNGVPWNGLISVTESSTGGMPQPYYVDGFKYLNLQTSEEFEATIRAFSSPEEFSICDGTKVIQNGLSITQQPRKTFNMCYRTMVANDVEGTTHGYKLHLVYNALAAPSQRNNSSLSESATPIPLSWIISTTPPSVSAYKPSAHMVVDSRSTPGALLEELEDILYGTEETSPSIPTISELIAMFTS